LKRFSEANEMERVTGIGGLFFRASDPDALAAWYEKHLGVTPAPSSDGDSVWRQDAGQTVFAPFPESTDYWNTAKAWMINFRVENLDRMVSQLSDAGVAVNIEESDYGRFARLHDPEGNPIELWEPQP
jgi:glyoxylase I family protein